MHPAPRGSLAAMLMLGRKYTTTPSNSKASLSTLATAILELERDVLAPPKFADFNDWRHGTH